MPEFHPGSAWTCSEIVPDSGKFRGDELLSASVPVDVGRLAEIWLPEKPGRTELKVYRELQRAKSCAKLSAPRNPVDFARRKLQDFAS